MKNDIELINFTELTLEEKKMVLEWRNHPDIRKWMYNQNEIKLTDHLNFIENLKNRKDKLYFLVKQDNKYIGVIDFYDIDKYECKAGLYKNPFEHLLGYGKILLKSCIDYAFNILKVEKLKLEVFKENEKAKRLYKKFNFKETEEKIINNQKVICMELENENRKP